jgi:hypothetical protein
MLHTKVALARPVTTIMMGLALLAVGVISEHLVAPGGDARSRSRACAS